MNIHIVILSFFILIFSGCLLTHQEIQQKSRSAQPYAEEEDIIEEDKIEVQDIKPEKKEVLKKKPSPSLSMTEEMAEITTSLRELRGEITRSHKEQEEKVTQLNQGLISLIQALDLRVTALAEDVEKLKKGPIKVQKQSATAVFNKAEQLFQQEKWKLAIIQYEKYRAQNKKGKMYKESTLKIGMCFQKLEMQKEAKVFFREVVESFPKSESAKVAHKLLAVSPDQKAPQ